MEIEVNEYVRTPIGIFIISHINIDFDDNDKNKCLLCQNEKVLFLSIETIKSLKHSKQLIDLVEVGDIVNEMEVLDIHKPRDLWEPIEIRVDSRYTNFILAEDIKTILTKEQFEANCYKLGVEDNE